MFISITTAAKGDASFLTARTIFWRCIRPWRAGSGISVSMRARARESVSQLLRTLAVSIAFIVLVLFGLIYHIKIE